MGLRKGSISPTGLGVSGGFEYGSLLMDVGEPNDS